MEMKERVYLTEGEHVTNYTLKAAMLMPFFFLIWLWFSQMQLFPETYQESC